MPVDFDYGSDSRVTTNITFGTSPDAKPFKVVMDTGSANFWVSLMQTLFAHITDIEIDLGTRGSCSLGIAISWCYWTL